MNYQNLVDTIRNTANFVNPTGTFVHGRRSDGSLEYNEAFPQIHLLLVRSEYDYNNANVRHNVIVMFWGQDSPESSNDERELLIATMDSLSDNFIIQLQTSTSFLITNVLKTPEYRQLAGTVSGYGLSFTIVSKTDYCL